MCTTECIWFYLGHKDVDYTTILYYSNHWDHCSLLKLVSVEYET